MNQRVHDLREGRLKVGFVPPDERVVSSATRLRCMNVCSALRSLGVGAFLCSPSDACRFDVVVVGRCYADFRRDVEIQAKLNAARIPAVYDFCDTIPARDQGLLSAFFDRFQALSVSSEGLRDAFQWMTSVRIARIDDLVDNAPGLGAPSFPKRLDPNGKVRFGWTGLAGNLDMMAPIFPLLRELNAELPGRFETIFVTNLKMESRKFSFASAKDYLDSELGIPFSLAEWSVDGCAELAARFWDVSPLPCDNELKSCNRLLFAAFAGSLPLASRIPESVHALGSSAPSVLCSSLEDWRATLIRAVVDPQWRAETLAKARAEMERRFSAQAIAKEWLSLLESALDAPIPERPLNLEPKMGSTEKKRQVEALRTIVALRWGELAARGVKRVALYGTGRHGKWLLPIIKGRAPEIVGFIDDAAAPGASHEGLPVLTLEEFKMESVDAIVLNTDVHRDSMLRRLRDLGAPEGKAFDVYAQLPPGPYEKGF